MCAIPYSFRSAKTQNWHATPSSCCRMRQFVEHQVRLDRRLLDVDPYLTNLLKNIDDGKSHFRLQKDATVYSQGDAAEAIYFIQDGKVKITVASAVGKEAVLAMLGPRSSLGEGCLVHALPRHSLYEQAQDLRPDRPQRGDHRESRTAYGRCSARLKRFLQGAILYSFRPAYLRQSSTSPSHVGIESRRAKNGRKEAQKHPPAAGPRIREI